MLLHLGSFITFRPSTSVLDPRSTKRTLQVGFCQTYGFFNKHRAFLEPLLTAKGSRSGICLVKAISAFLFGYRAEGPN